MTYYVYILKSKKNGKYYIGQTNNISNRLNQHNSGYSKSTKNSITWELKYYQFFNSRSEAVKFETKLKKMKSKTILEKLISEGERPDINREGQRFDPA